MSIEQVRQILETRRASLEAITTRLIEAEVMDGTDLRDIVETTSGKPQLVPGTGPERRGSAKPSGETPASPDTDAAADAAGQS